MSWSEDRYQIGSREAYLPTLYRAPILLAGDTTCLFPLEADAALGRGGLVESIIESMLWDSWLALPIGRAKLATGSGLAGLLRSARRCDWAPESLFTTQELTGLAAGITASDLGRGPYSGQLSLSNPSVVVLAGITGSFDRILKLRLNRELSRARFDQSADAVIVHYIKVSGHQPYEGFFQVPREKLSAALFSENRVLAEWLGTSWTTMSKRNSRHRSSAAAALIAELSALEQLAMRKHQPDKGESVG